MASIHSDDTHLHSFDTLDGFLLPTKTLWSSLPARYEFPAKTIGYSQFYALHILDINNTLNSLNIISTLFSADFGAMHHRFPLEEIVFGE